MYKKGLIVHEDNEPAHTLSVEQFLADRHVTALECSAYLPDFVPCDLF